MFKVSLPCQPYQARDGVCFAHCCACTYSRHSVRVWCTNEWMNEQMNELHGPPRIWRTWGFISSDFPASSFFSHCSHSGKIYFLAHNSQRGGGHGGLASKCI